jgi:hypothetical protein
MALTSAVYLHKSQFHNTERWNMDYLYKSSAVLVCCVVGNTYCSSHNAHDMDLRIASDQQRLSAIEYVYDEQNRRTRNVSYASQI